MTPDDLAEGICAALARAEAAFDKRGWVEMPKADRNRYVERALLAKPLIATALRKAENDKLEEAAKMADEHWCSTSRDGAHSMTFDHGPSLADLIRSLKSDQPLDIVKVGTAAFERGLNSKSKGTP